MAKVKLRHISGGNLKELEAQLEGITKNSIVIQGVNFVGTNWYIHFLVQDVYNDNLNTAEELGLNIKSPLLKKKGK